jgi:hypothetical protein
MRKIIISLAACALTYHSAHAAVATTQSKVTANGLVGYSYTPAIKGKLPAVLILGGSEGGLNPAVVREATLIAEQGYVVLQLGYFDVPGRPKNLESLPLEYFKAGIDWLRAQDNVNAARIGIVGTSKGGEAALLVASLYTEVKAVVAGVPSSVVWPGIKGTHNGSSWSLDGKDLPALPYGFEGGVTSVFALYEKGLKKLPEHPDTAIAVEKISGPILLICGRSDALWPSCPMSEQIVARLKAQKFRHRYQLLAYDDAGHASSGPPLPSDSERLPLLGGENGGSPTGTNAARADSWPKLLAFLASALKR